MTHVGTLIAGMIIGCLSGILLTFVAAWVAAKHEQSRPPTPTAAGWSNGHNFVELARLIMRQTVGAVRGIEQRGALGTVTAWAPEPLADSPGWYRLGLDVQFYCEPAPDAVTGEPPA